MIHPPSNMSNLPKFIRLLLVLLLAATGGYASCSCGAYGAPQTLVGYVPYNNEALAFGSFGPPQAVFGPSVGPPKKLNYASGVVYDEPIYQTPSTASPSFAQLRGISVDVAKYDGSRAVATQSIDFHDNSGSLICVGSFAYPPQGSLPIVGGSGNYNYAIGNCKYEQLPGYGPGFYKLTVEYRTLSS